VSGRRARENKQRLSPFATQRVSSASNEPQSDGYAIDAAAATNPAANASVWVAQQGAAAAGLALEEAPAEEEIGAHHLAAGRGHVEAQLAEPERREQLGRQIEDLPVALDAEPARDRPDEREARVEGRLATHRPALAAERVGNGLIQEDSFMQRRTDDELVTHGEHAGAGDVPEDRAEVHHRLGPSASLPRSSPRMSSAAVSMSNMDSLAS
jgi:hypothetical protein